MRIQYMVAFLFLFHSIGSALFGATVNVSLRNPSFEYPQISQGTVPYKRVEGWNRKEYLHVRCPELRNPPSGSAIMPTHGSNYMVPAQGEIFQIAENIQSGSVYTFTIHARRLSASTPYNYNFRLSVRDTVFPYQTEFAQADQKTQGNFGLTTSWQSVMLTLDAGANPQWVGKPLMIILYGDGIAVDNARLVKTVPDDQVRNLTISAPSSSQFLIEPGVGTYSFKAGDTIYLRAADFRVGEQQYIFDRWIGDAPYPYQAEMSVVLTDNLTLEAVYRPAETAAWDVMADTWVATDGLNRTLSDFAKAGPPRKNKFVATYYCLWLTSETRDYQGPYDITKLLSANPTNPAWGPRYVFHHWGEPELGYYKSVDDYAMKRHAYDLASAGVDLIVLEATNISQYTTQYLTFCDALQELKRRGMIVPKICFWIQPQLLEPLYNEFYRYNLHSDLWFYHLGKPLAMVVAYNLPSNPIPQYLQDYFTIRPTWDHYKGQDIWSAGHYYPQEYGWNISSDKPEEVAVTVARHATTNVGRSYSNGSQPPYNQYHLTGLEGQGRFFEEQFKRVMEIDPMFVFVLEWNEWVAQRFIYPEGDGNTKFLGNNLVNGQTYFVDQYNAEYSRDIEPVKGGYYDNYYYQFVDMIRRFKGVRPPLAASDAKTIAIDGQFDEWQDVAPEYRDYIGDTLHRDELGYADHTRYLNTTGRNDFVAAKVARDASNVYFYARTRHPITAHIDPNWMLLFIDIDRSKSTGWQGYDFLINHTVVSSSLTTLKSAASGWNWTVVSNAIEYAVNGNEIEIKIPRSLLGLPVGGADIAFDFKWADNIQSDDDISQFALMGDAAPDRRFNYRYDSSIRQQTACQRDWNAGLGLLADANRDCRVDVSDLALLAEQWLYAIGPSAPSAVAIYNPSFEIPTLPVGGTSSGATGWTNLNPPQAGVTYNVGSSSDGANLLSINAYSAGIYQDLTETVAAATVYQLSADVLVPSYTAPPAWDPSKAWFYMALMTTDGQVLKTVGSVRDTSFLAGNAQDVFYPYSLVWSSSELPAAVGKPLKILLFGANVYLDNIRLTKKTAAGALDIDANQTVELGDFAAIASLWLDDLMPLYQDGIVLLADDFEMGNFGNWTGWTLSAEYADSPTTSISCNACASNLTSRVINTSGYKSMTISFKYRMNSNIGDADDFFVQFHNGSSYVNIQELGKVTSANKMWNVWARFTKTVYNTGSEAVFFHPNFRIRFTGNGIGTGESVQIDDVRIIVN